MSGGFVLRDTHYRSGRNGTEPIRTSHEGLMEITVGDVPSDAFKLYAMRCMVVAGCRRNGRLHPDHNLRARDK